MSDYQRMQTSEQSAQERPPWVSPFMSPQEWYQRFRDQRVLHDPRVHNARRYVPQKVPSRF